MNKTNAGVIVATCETMLYFFGVDALEQHRLIRLNRENLNQFRHAAHIEMVDLVGDSSPEYIVTTAADSTYILLDDNDVLRPMTRMDIDTMPYASRKSLENRLEAMDVEIE